MKIIAAGDLSNQYLERRRFDEVADNLKSLIIQSDVFIVNLEGALSAKPAPKKGYIKNPIIEFVLTILKSQQPPVVSTPDLLDFLNKCKNTVVCLANNHVLDAGVSELAYCRSFLKEHGIHVLGSGMNIEEAGKSVSVEVGAERLAVLNVNFIGWRKAGFFINVFGAGKNKAGTYYASYKTLKKRVAELKSESDYVVLSVHAGRLFTDTLDAKTDEALSALGADLVVVHHPHEVQKTHGKAVYSVGDFMFHAPTLPDREGFVIEADSKSGKIIRHVIWLEHGFPVRFNPGER